MPKKTEKKDTSDKQDASFYTSISRFYDHIFPFSPQQQRFIMKHIQNPKTASLLEIGCGTGSLSLELSRRCRFCEGIDLDDTMIRIAQQKLESSRTRQEVSETEASEKNNGAEAEIPRRTEPSHSAPLSPSQSASLSSAESASLSYVNSDSARPHAEFRVLDMMDIASAYKAESFTVIFSFGNTLVHLASLQEMLSVLQSAHRLISSGGRLLLQIINYDRIIDQNIRSLPLIDNSSITFQRRYTYSPESHRILFSTALTDKKRQQTSVQELSLYPLRKQELQNLLQSAGFTDLHWYGGFDFSPLLASSIPLIVSAEKAE